MARPAAAPAIFGLLAFEIPGDDVADRRAEDAVIRDTEGREECQLTYQNSVGKTAWGRRRAGGDVELEREAISTRDVHRCDRKIRLIVRVAARPISAHNHSAGQVAGLETAIHSGFGRVENIELARRGIRFGAEHFIVAP